MGRLEWNRQVERDRNVLERILALLLALAALTERAAGLPMVDRLRFLAVMGCGEAEARDFILAMASGPSPATPSEATATSFPAADDAALLAARFRMLALALGAMLMQARAPCRHASPAASREPRRSSQFTPSPALRATSPPQAGGGAAASMTTSFLRTGARAPVAIGVRFPATMAIGAPLPRAGGEVAREA